MTKTRWITTSESAEKVMHFTDGTHAILSCWTHSMNSSSWYIRVIFSDAEPHDFFTGTLGQVGHCTTEESRKLRDQAKKKVTKALETLAKERGKTIKE